MKKIIRLVLLFFSLSLFLILPHTFILHAAPTTNTSTIDKTLPKVFCMSASSLEMKIDNTLILLDKGERESSAMPNVFKEVLMVPIKPLATVFKGNYTYDPKTSVATLILDGTTFTFTMDKASAKVNGKEVIMPFAARIDHGSIRVPAQVFVNQLKNYNVTIHHNFYFILVQKVGSDFYDADGLPIGVNVPLWSNGVIGPSPEDSAKALLLADNVLKKIITPNMNDYEKVLAINDYLVDNTSYDLTLQTTGFYAPLLEGKGICQGYAATAELLLNKAGVETICVPGYEISSKELDNNILDAINFRPLHLWNMVKIDGKTYHLDVTHNDSFSNGVQLGTSRYDYVLLSDAEAEKTRMWRKGFFPSCPDTFYDTELISDLARKGYACLWGTISLPNGIIAPKDGIEVTVTVSAKNNQSYSRKTTIPEGKNSTYFTIILGKQYNSPDLKESLRFSTNIKGYLDTLSISGDNTTGYTARLIAKNGSTLSGKLVLPDTF